MREPKPTLKGKAASRLWQGRRALLAAAGGVLFALSVPPTDLLVGVLLGMAMLAGALRGARGFWRGFGLGALWGTAAGLVGMRFVPSVIQLFTPLGLAASLAAHVLLSAAQSLSWAIGMGAVVWASRRLRTPPELAFAAGVFATLLLPAVFVWTPAGLISPWTAWVQSAEYIGERGVSALLALAAALAARAVARIARTGRLHAGLRRLAWAGALLVALPLAGRWAQSRFAAAPAPEQTVRVGLVHIGLDPKARWQKGNQRKILRALQAQTAAVERQGVELTIWPEAAYPYPLRHGTRRAPKGSISPLGPSVRGPILLGLITTAPPEYADGRWVRDRYNSATIVMSDGRLQPSYDKMELLWFGETVPLGQHLPWLRRLFQRSGGLRPGRELRALELERGSTLPPQRIGVLNCYEDTLPGLGRRIARELEPNLLVNVTNDAWFVGTAEPELHLRLAVMRSVELRRDMVRSVNLGIGGWIDARGVVRARLEAPGPGHRVVTPRLRAGPPTLYARYGDAPLGAALLLGIALLALRPGRKSRAHAYESSSGSPHRDSF